MGTKINLEFQKALEKKRILPFNGSEMYPWLDIHGAGSRGNGVTGLSAGMGGEVYGNYYNSGGGYLMSFRGGRLAFHHNMSSSGVINIYVADGCPTLAQGDRQKINNSYMFSSRKSATGSLIGWYSAGGDNCGGEIVENTTFWMDNSSCQAPNTCSNITVGIGCGTLANRPASCTTGTGYWATSQSCTNLTGMVGVNPAMPIAGTLYKCTATNTWTAYYTPYTYPHPLTSSGDTTPPAAPTGVMVE